MLWLATDGLSVEYGGQRYDVSLSMGARRFKDVADLLETGGEHDDALVDAFANDLVGAQLVILAALTATPPCRVSGAERGELEELDRGARTLLRTALAALRGR